MTPLKVLLISVILYNASASSERLQSSLQTLLDLLSPALSPVKSSINLFKYNPKLKPKTLYSGLSDDSDSEGEDHRHYWVEYLLRSQKGSVREGADETPSNVLNALRQRCNKVAKCVKKCPPKKKTCQKTCSQILDEEDYCKKPKDTCGPKCGKTMPPYFLRTFK